MYEFLKSFAPHLTRRLIDQAIRAGEGPELDALFSDLDLPLR
jgi:LysR family cys regulon transcriptional activator